MQPYGAPYGAAGLPYGAAAYGGGLTSDGVGQAKEAERLGIKHFGLRRHRRMNIFAMCLAVFLPWLIFVFTHAMLSFWMHYWYPAICTAIIISGFALIGGLWLKEVAQKCAAMRRGQDEEMAPREWNWFLFIMTTSLIAFIVALLLGDSNFSRNTQVYYDISNLNTYTEVNPATVRGQELMDAGLASFVTGTQVNLKYAMSFRNSDTYCVAPITLRDTPLSSYDYWAVGTNCCADTGSLLAQAQQQNRETGANWKCPGFESLAARGGLRVMRNADRSFFRLAVQQAQSAYNIRATHPLFFYWTEDPAAEAYGYMLEGFREFLIGMYTCFVVQLLLVAFVSVVFVPGVGADKSMG